MEILYTLIICTAASAWGCGNQQVSYDLPKAVCFEALSAIRIDTPARLAGAGIKGPTTASCLPQPNNYARQSKSK